MTTQQTVKVQLVRSPIGCKESHRATVRGLGLRKIRSISELQGHARSARHDQQDQLPGQGPLRELTKEDDGTQ
jgi:ribosomal protein L30